MSLILVVDDEPSIVQTICALLEAYDFQAVGVNSGNEAIAKLDDVCPDLLVCDVIMPGLNGFDTGLRIKERCPKCRLLFLSAYAHSPELHAMSDGLTKHGHRFDVLAKPMHPTSLLDKIKALLGEL